MDYFLNGDAHGSVASMLMDNNFDVNALRPWKGQDGRSYVTSIQNGKPEVKCIGNATSLLRKDDWKILDEAVIKAAQPRLKAVGDLRRMGLTYNIPNGMAKTVLETEMMSDINDATISMDGLREGANDRPKFELINLPLPIIHYDFSFSARQIAVSRNGGSPLDTTMAELAGRKVAEAAEKLLLGNWTADDQYTYGGGTIYGYTDFPDRTTRTLTTPTGSNGTTTVTEVLAMKADAYADYHYGPYVLYNAPNWDQYLDNEFKTYSDRTLRERIGAIDQIDGPYTLDYLTNYDMLLVQKSTDVVREVIGMDITTVQWESNGGMKLNFKVMAIMVPQLRSDINDRSGIVHGSV
jgi:hypothetical protein